MKTICVLLLFLGSTICSANDQKHWERIQSLVCGNRPLITDEQLSQLESKCKITREEKGPVSSCASKKLENNRQLLEAFCNTQTFACVQNKPLLCDSDLKSSDNPEQLKEQLVGCIENVIKYNYYLFDDKINFN